MGSCFSSEGNQVTPTAKVISFNGNLRQYSVPVTVRQVLAIEITTSCFLCNSDQLYYDEYIKPMDFDDELEVGQIYFVLPTSRLQYRLTASDMAALAVKASSALTGISNKDGGRRKMMRISPVLEMNQKSIEYDALKKFEKSTVGTTTTTPMMRSGSVRKLRRSSSRRARMVYRSFKMRLSTIVEGSVAE